MGYEVIKLELIEWFTKLQDVSTLKYLKLVKDSKISNHDWWNDLTEDQKKSIERGMKEGKEGKIIAHKGVIKRYGI